MPVEMHQNERPLEESDNDLNTRNKWKTTSTRVTDRAFRKLIIRTKTLKQ